MGLVRFPYMHIGPNCGLEMYIERAAECGLFVVNTADFRKIFSETLIEGKLDKSTDRATSLAIDLGLGLLISRSTKLYEIPVIGAEYSIPFMIGLGSMGDRYESPRISVFRTHRDSYETRKDIRTLSSVHREANGAIEGWLRFSKKNDAIMLNDEEDGFDEIYRRFEEYVLSGRYSKPFHISLSLHITDSLLVNILHPTSILKLLQKMSVEYWGYTFPSFAGQQKSLDMVSFDEYKLHDTI